ncbi:hypothetical protein T4D_4269, partial [Trichinella pseudospiralis]
MQPVGHWEFYQLPIFMRDDDIKVYYDYLDVQQKNMQERLQDIFTLKIPNWVTDSF